MKTFKIMKKSTAIGIVAIAILGFYILFNFLMDPLMVFGISTKRSIKNEARIKINRMHFGNDRFDTLIIGGAKATFIDADRFEHLKVFNFAMDGTRPDNFGTLLEFVKESKGQLPHMVLIFLDFDDCGRNQAVATVKSNQKIEKYISKTESRGYKIKYLLSPKTFWYGLKNISMRGKSRHAYYDEKGRKTLVNKDITMNNRPAKEDIEKKIAEKYKEAVFDMDLNLALKSLKEKYPDTKFVVALLPDIYPYYFTDENTRNIYRQCMSTAINTFGYAYTFMYPVNITRDSNNYYDTLEFKPPVGDLIVHKIENPRFYFGRILEKDDLNIFMEVQRSAE